MHEPRIKPELFEFLSELKFNNDRTWFETNRQRYYNCVRDPMLGFISDFAPILADISPHMRADPRPNGGSLFRIHRDVRFSKDKSPYKTNVGAHFRHASAKDAHAPGIYLHLEPGGCFAGCGIWRPGGKALLGIRQAISDHPDEWSKITSDSKFSSEFRLGGESLVRPPRGFDPNHPLIDDLKRKDFIASMHFAEDDACSDDFPKRFAGWARTGAPFMGFLCRALGVPF